MNFCLEKQRPDSGLEFPLDFTLDNGLSLWKELKVDTKLRNSCLGLNQDQMKTDSIFKTQSVPAPAMF